MSLRISQGNSQRMVWGGGELWISEGHRQVAWSLSLFSSLLPKGRMWDGDIHTQLRHTVGGTVAIRPVNPLLRHAHQDGHLPVPLFFSISEWPSEPAGLSGSYDLCRAKLGNSTLRGMYNAPGLSFHSLRGLAEATERGQRSTY